MAALTWGIAIPFREDPDQRIDRGNLLSIVLRYLSEVVPKALVVLVDSDPSLPFNRAGARNACVRIAEEQGWEVVVILDADTLPLPALLLQAVEAAALGGIHQPFRYCITLAPEKATPPGSLTVKHLESAERVWVSPGSCYILKPEVYWSMGGQDEGFVNWGGEDSAFMLTAKALNVPVVRHPTTPTVKPTPSNTAVQLHHGDASDRRLHPTYGSTKLRQSIYYQLSRNPIKIRQWLAERHLDGAEQKWATRHAIQRWSPPDGVT